MSEKKQLNEKDLDNVNGGVFYDEPEQVKFKYQVNDVVRIQCWSKDGISMMLKDATIFNRGYVHIATGYIPCYLLSCDGAIGWYLEDLFDEKKRQEEIDWTEC